MNDTFWVMEAKIAKIKCLTASNSCLLPLEDCRKQHRPQLERNLHIRCRLFGLSK